MLHLEPRKATESILGNFEVIHFYRKLSENICSIMNWFSRDQKKSQSIDLVPIYKTKCEQSQTAKDCLK